MKKNKLYWQIPLLVLLVVGTIFIARQQRSEDKEQDVQFLHNEGFMFGTTYRLTYQSGVDLHEEAERAMKDVDAEFSMFNPKSTVAAINRGEKPALSRMYKEVWQLAQDVNKDTDGAFDVTVAPLVNAWGFGFKTGQQPTPSQVDSLLKVRSELDFSAIAKGYGSDQVARVFDSLGVKNYMVEIGGEVVTRGHNPHGQPWRIGVNKPVEDPENVELQAVLQVDNAALATSGNYRNFYYKGGRKYAHTIDPRTGYPVQHELLSATVVTKQCAVADAYATSFMVLGLEKSKALLQRHPELKAYFIYTDEQGKLAVWHTDGLTIEDN